MLRGGSSWCGVAAAVPAPGGAIAAGVASQQTASASGLQHVLCWCAVQARICRKAICIRARTRTPAAQISKAMQFSRAYHLIGCTLKHG